MTLTSLEKRMLIYVLDLFDGGGLKPPKPSFESATDCNSYKRLNFSRLPNTFSAAVNSDLTRTLIRIFFTTYKLYKLSGKITLTFPISLEKQLFCRPYWTSLKVYLSFMTMWQLPVFRNYDGKCCSHIWWKLTMGNSN